MLLRDIINAAARKTGVLASGETLSPDEAKDVLLIAQALILEHPGLSNARWRDVYATSNAEITARDGQRINAGAFTPTVILPATTSQWGCVRAMPDLSRVKVVGGPTDGLWLYSDEWRQADDLEEESENPFGADTDLGLICQLAVKMSEDFGSDLGPVTVATAQRSEKTIRGRLYRANCQPWRDDYGLLVPDEA